MPGWSNDRNRHSIASHGAKTRPSMTVVADLDTTVSSAIRFPTNGKPPSPFIEVSKSSSRIRTEHLDISTTELYKHLESYTETPLADYYLLKHSKDEGIQSAVLADILMRMHTNRMNRLHTVMALDELDLPNDAKNGIYNINPSLIDVKNQLQYVRDSIYDIAREINFAQYIPPTLVSPSFSTSYIGFIRAHTIHHFLGLLSIDIDKYIDPATSYMLYTEYAIYNPIQNFYIPTSTVEPLYMCLTKDDSIFRDDNGLLTLKKIRDNAIEKQMLSLAVDKFIHPSAMKPPLRLDFVFLSDKNISKREQKSLEWILAHHIQLLRDKVSLDEFANAFGPANNALDNMLFRMKSVIKKDKDLYNAIVNGDSNTAINRIRYHVEKYYQKRDIEMPPDILNFIYNDERMYDYISSTLLYRMHNTTEDKTINMFKELPDDMPIQKKILAFIMKYSVDYLDDSMKSNLELIAASKLKISGDDYKRFHRDVIKSKTMSELIKTLNKYSQSDVIKNFKLKMYYNINPVFSERHIKLLDKILTKDTLSDKQKESLKLLYANIIMTNQKSSH